jgi:hypothetical protein
MPYSYKALYEYLNVCILKFEFDMDQRWNMDYVCDSKTRTPDVLVRNILASELYYSSLRTELTHYSTRVKICRKYIKPHIRGLK